MSREGLLLPYRLRTVRTGVQATYLVVAGVAAVPFLPTGQRFDAIPYIVILAIAVAGGTMVALLPWRRLFERGLGMPFMYTWSALDILLITALIPFTGGADSHVFWLYTLTAFFMAASYPPRAQAALLGFTYASYATILAVTGGPISAGDIVLRFAILAVLTFMASFLSRELMSQVAAHTDARRESERRATLLSTVAGASRNVSTLESDRVLASVVDAAGSLGFEVVTLCLIDPTDGTYRVVHPHGMPPGFADRTHPASQGLQAIVRERGETIVVDDYATHPKAIAELAALGLRAGILTPVWVGDHIAAVLAATTRDRRPLGPEVVEAFELLAAHAGRALENARRFEEERETVRRMADLNRLKKDFLSNVSHELRTPLTAIEGMGLTLEQRWRDLGDDRRFDFLRRMNANARALDDLITNLLDFSRMDSGHIEPEIEPINVTDVLRQAVNRLASLFEDGALTVKLAAPLYVSADRRLIDRVAENLLSNAAKHTPKGTPVHLSVRRDGETAVVEVADEGPGIPEDELVHLGERFYRGGDVNTRSTKGTGLGLAFAQEILALHHTRLEIHSVLGTGSTFAFRLPLVEAGSDESTPRERRVAAWT